MGEILKVLDFIHLPIVLIEDEEFKGLSIDAKVLYSIYLSRSALSYKNNWIDENGRVYIYFTVEETSKQLCCGMKKAVKLIKDLEEIGRDFMELYPGANIMVATKKDF